MSSFLVGKCCWHSGQTGLPCAWDSQNFSMVGTPGFLALNASSPHKSLWQSEMSPHISKCFWLFMDSQSVLDLFTEKPGKTGHSLLCPFSLSPLFPLSHPIPLALSIPPSLFLSSYLSVYLSTPLSACPSIHPPIHPTTHLSISFFFVFFLLSFIVV